MEEAGDRSFVKYDALNNVGLLDSPSSNDWFVFEFFFNLRFLVLNVLILFNLLDSFKAGFVGKELVDIVNY